MDIPNNALLLARAFEGFSPKPYICPAGFWTIGYGHLCVKDHPPINEIEGLAYLAQDLRVAFNATITLCPILLEDENRLGAITDFTFNLGAGRLQKSTLRRMINKQDYDEVPKQLKRWVYGGGRILKGLVVRREAEAAFFL